MFLKFGRGNAIFLTVVMGLALSEMGCTNTPPPGLDIQPGGKDGGTGGARTDARDTAVSSDTFKNICAPDARAKIRSKGDTCACDLECQSGFCVNGICCNSACTEGCKSCNVAGSVGECVNAPASTLPANPSFCPIDPRSSCQNDGTCDGKGGCRKYLEGTECNPGICDGDSIINAFSCDGKGRCAKPSAKETCWPFSCDPRTIDCIRTCAGDRDCAGGQKCVNGSCGFRLNGATCETHTECLSGYCTDGVCCNVACTGPCRSCNQLNSRGTCELDPKGADDLECAPDPAAICGKTGQCDGSGNCSIADTTVTCAPSVCSGSTQKTDIRVCDGQGTCKTPQIIDCYPFLCASGTCIFDCKSDKDCADDKACVFETKNGVTTGSCGKRRDGVPCGAASDCQSNFCVDGVCCEGACTGSCRSCNLKGSAGRCLNVPLDLPDPHGLCKDTGASSCQTTGRCDGAGACQKYKANTQCAPSTCVEGMYTPPSECNSSNQCIASKAISCGNTICKDSTKCFDSCTSNDQCAAGKYCVNASCGLKTKGLKCSAGKECESGFCAQGVCCDKACTEACRACNLSASLGVCTIVKDNTPDPQEKCTNPNKDPCGYTGSCRAGACAFAKKDTNCKEAVCATTTSKTPAFTCDGAGKCESKATTSCAPYICTSGLCKDGCTTNADCAPPNICQNGSCGLKPNGQTCTAANQCSSGFCVEGYCCNNACTGLCKSCAVTGSIGTCSNVAQGGTDPGNRCIASTVESGNFCAFNGTCDGAGACDHRATSEGCRAASCTNAVLTLAANCNGSGACPAVVTASCGNYQCHSSGTSCLTTCTTAADCTGGLPCTTNPATGQRQCGLTLPDGEPCETNANCTNLHCVENVCCNDACTNLCNSCNLSGTRGQCVPVPLGQDPRNACTATTPTAAGGCANDGTCNGAGACNPWSTATVCRAASCTSGTATPQATCDGAGNCPTATTQSCIPYICGTNACKTECNPTGSDCSSGYTCVGTQCKKVLGQTCGGDGECASNFCTDGVCCGVDDCGTCKTCSASGACVAKAGISGTTCNDANACTEGDICAADGSCAGTPKNCSDGLSCTTDSCSGGTCSNVFDNNGCLISGACYAAGATNPDNQCQICTPSTSTTAWSNKGDSTSCNDGNACTKNDICTTGACGGTAFTCDDNLACTTDTCNGNGCTFTPTTGNCVIESACYAANVVNLLNSCEACIPAESQTTWRPRVGANCNDGNLCTSNDTCTSEGICAGTTYSCNDSLTCTADTCNGDGNCTHTPNAGTCAIGTECYSETTVNPSNPCQACITTTSQTGWSPRTGVVCNDSNSCTSNDLCTGAGTCSGTPYVCDDSKTCTTDVCNGDGTCTHQLISGNCLIGTACYATNAVNPVNQCQICTPTTNTTDWSNKNDGDSCSDGNECTQTDTCQSGTCTGSNPVVCTTSNQCLVAGTCNTSSGVCSDPTNAADGAPCEDGNACTNPDTCVSGACTAGPNTCGGSP